MGTEEKSEFEILSYYPIIRMIFDLKIEEKIFQVPVSVDYTHKKVYFEDNFSLNVDYNFLEFKIFESLGLSVASPPPLDSAVLEKVRDVRSGKYGQEDLEL